MEPAPTQARKAYVNIRFLATLQASKEMQKAMACYQFNCKHIKNVCYNIRFIQNNVVREKTFHISWGDSGTGGREVV